MANIPDSVAAFLGGPRIVVAGVTRRGDTPANVIFRRLRDSGHEAIPVNPHATEVEGHVCYPDIRSVSDPIHGDMIVTHPSVSAAVAREAIERGVRHVWFHRSLGDGSVSAETTSTVTSDTVGHGSCTLS